jgi:hypothetical protein
VRAFRAARVAHLKNLQPTTLRGACAAHFVQFCFTELNADRTREATQETVMRKRITLAVLAIGPAFWLSALGCAGSPPKEAIASAQTLVQRAEQQGAGQFAPRPLREAKDKLEKAESEVNDDHYSDARRLAEQAQLDAKLAAVEADRGKTKEAVAELARTVQALENDVRSERAMPPLSTPLPTDPLKEVR